MKNIFLFFIKIYQTLISPAFVLLFGHSCKFSPTCSHYASEAIGRFGVIKGSMLAGKRILRCNPLFDGGYDPLAKT